MTTADKLLLNKLDELIDGNINNPAFSIDYICETLGVSRSNLFRLVKDHAQMSPTLCIRQRRLDQAKDLLKNTPLRITEIAERVGIDSPQNFSKYFTDTMGISPTEFRKRAGQSTAEPPASPTPEPPVLSQPEAPGRPETVAESVSAGPLRFRRWGLWAGGVVGMALLIWGGIDRFAPAQLASAALVADNSIAVLPFRTGGSEEILYLSEGITDQVQAALTLIEPLKVISRTSTLGYAQTTKPVPQIARELGVSYLLGGRIRQLGNRVKLSVELIRAEQNKTVWTNTYEGEMKDVAGFTRTIAKQIAGELNQTLSAVLRAKIDKPLTRNPQAFTEYLKGQYLMRSRTKEGLENSLMRFNRAIALDTTFAGAYAGKSMAYFLYASENYGNEPVSLRLAEDNALLAVRLDPENAMAYALLAKFYQQQNKWEQARTAFQIALRYEPNNAIINYWYSLVLRSLGQFDAAIAYSTKALSLDPLYPTILFGHVGNLSYTGRFAEARATIAEGQRLYKDMYMLYYVSGFYYLNLGQPVSAVHEFEHGLLLNRNALSMRVYWASTQAMTGQVAPARALLDSLPHLSQYYDERAVLYAGQGQRDSCLHYIERGGRRGQPAPLRRDIAGVSVCANRSPLRSGSAPGRLATNPTNPLIGQID